ncbi:hypothetical protein DPMN_075915 [Dreissena polymorpha]|uniref:C2H2-type domain-containing protein n=1 Tax=Dreissena polymorpha TaxID=45954 RepID=A0A9D3YHV8_DREPO|nr:hypothetical protein DPMN_075915 [Dreissena polymorpha]
MKDPVSSLDRDTPCCSFREVVGKTLFSLRSLAPTSTQIFDGNQHQGAGSRDFFGVPPFNMDGCIHDVVCRAAKETGNAVHDRQSGSNCCYVLLIVDISIELLLCSIDRRHIDTDVERCKRTEHPVIDKSHAVCSYCRLPFPSAKDAVLHCAHEHPNEKVEPGESR